MKIQSLLFVRNIKRFALSLPGPSESKFNFLFSFYKNRRVFAANKYTNNHFLIQNIQDIALCREKPLTNLLTD